MLIGPFLMDRNIDADALGSARLAEVQNSLVAELDRDQRGGWVASKLTAAPNGVRYDVDAYESLLPTSFVQWGGDAPAELRRIDASSTSWTLRDLTIDVFAFGVGVFSAEYAVRATVEMSAESLARAFDAANRELIPPASTFTHAIAQRLREAIDVACVGVANEAWHVRVDNAQNAHADAAQSSAGLLWLHRVVLLRTPDGCLPDYAAGLAGFLQERVRFNDFEFLAATDRSVAASRVQAEDGDTVGEHALLRVIRLQWAWFAAAGEVDRALFVQLGKIATEGKQLERDLQAATYLLDDVRHWRARLDSVLADLGGGSIALWDALGAVSKVDQLFKATDDKLEALRATIQGRLETATANRQRKLDRTVYLFAIFNVVASILAGAVFILGDTEDFDETRLLAVLLVTLTVALFFAASRR